MARTIKVTIMAGPVEIGTSSIAARDYGMAVASGVFIANEAYFASAHAALIEGEQSSSSASLHACTAGGERIACELVAVSDYSASVGPDGREVEIYGLDVALWFGPASVAD